MELAPQARRRWRVAAKLALAVLLLDQLLLWTVVTRPAASLRNLIELTDRDAPPYYRLRANLATTWTLWSDAKATQVHTNALGMRSPERPLAKPPGVKRVVLMGDSVTFGIGVNDGETVAVRLQEAATRSDVEVWNAGVPGYGMADFAGQLPLHVLPLQPDLVLLQLSRNDSLVPMHLTPGFMALARVSGLARAYLLWRFNFLSDHRAYSDALRRFLATARDAGVPVLIWPEGVPERQNDELVSIAQAYGAVVRATHADTIERLQGDPHFSVLGNRQAAERLWPMVQERLEGRLPAKSDYP